MRTIYLQHEDTGQLAMLTGARLTVIRLKDCGFTLPGSISKLYEIAIIEGITPDYMDALCKANISLARNEWQKKLTELIHTLTA